MKDLSIGDTCLDLFRFKATASSIEVIHYYDE